MVKKLAVFFGFVLFFLLSLMYFTPKENIYFALENELKKYDVIISNESVSDNGFTLSLSDAELFFKSIKSADIKEIDIKIFGLYNAVNIYDVKLSKSASSFLPLNIQKVTITHSIFNPLNVKIYELGDDGELEGSFNLLEMALHIIFEPSELMLEKYKNSMREFKKSEDGSYSYDKTF